MVDGQLIEDAAAKLIEHLVQRAGLQIEPRRKGHDDGPGLLQGQHIAQMDAGERAFPRHQHERPPLLEADIRRALQQIARHSGRQRAQRVHGAGRDDHAVVPPGTACRGRGHIVRRMDHMRQPGELVRLRAALGPEHGLRPLRNDEVKLQSGQRPALPQQAQSQRHAACAADAEKKGLASRHAGSIGENGPP